MTTTKFSGNWHLTAIVTIGLIVFFVLGYIERGLPEASSLINLLGVALIAYSSYGSINTYLEILENRTLINKGYREFGFDKVDIYDIKYIYRVPGFAFKAWGSNCMMYLRGKDGKLEYSAFREKNYSDDTLKAFLEKMLDINPNVQLDPQYLEFLDEKYAGQDFTGTRYLGLLIGVEANRTITDVEAELMEKGEIL